MEASSPPLLAAGLTTSLHFGHPTWLAGRTDPVQTCCRILLMLALIPGNSGFTTFAKSSTKVGGCFSSSGGSVAEPRAIILLFSSRSWLAFSSLRWLAFISAWVHASRAGKPSASIWSGEADFLHALTRWQTSRKSFLFLAGSSATAGGDKTWTLDCTLFLTPTSRWPFADLIRWYFVRNVVKACRRIGLLGVALLLPLLLLQPSCACGDHATSGGPSPPAAPWGPGSARAALGSSGGFALFSGSAPLSRKDA